MAVQLEACFWKEKWPSWLFDMILMWRTRLMMMNHYDNSVFISRMVGILGKKKKKKKKKKKTKDESSWYLICNAQQHKPVYKTCFLLLSSLGLGHHHHCHHHHLSSGLTDGGTKRIHTSNQMDHQARILKPRTFRLEREGGRKEKPNLARCSEKRKGQVRVQIHDSLVWKTREQWDVEYLPLEGCTSDLALCISVHTVK